jgi:hypothetical protein
MSLTGEGSKNSKLNASACLITAAAVDGEAKLNVLFRNSAIWAALAYFPGSVGDHSLTGEVFS